MTFAHSAEVVKLKRKLEELEAENAALRSQVETAMDDGERAISAVLKLELDLKCLEDSTVDAKAFEQLKAENAELLEENARLKALVPDPGEPPHPRVIDSLVLRIAELERENKSQRLSEDLVGTIKMCEARATRMMRGEDAGIGPIVSCLRDILALAQEQKG